MRLYPPLALAFALGLLVACGGEADYATAIIPYKVSYSLTPPSLSLAVGEERALVVKRLDTLIAPPVVRWASSDTVVAIVTDGGVVRARRAGTATVTVTSRTDASLAAASFLTVR